MTAAYLHGGPHVCICVHGKKGLLSINCSTCLGACTRPQPACIGTIYIYQWCTFVITLFLHAFDFIASTVIFSIHVCDTVLLFVYVFVIINYNYRKITIIIYNLTLLEVIYFQVIYLEIQPSWVLLFETTFFYLVTRKQVQPLHTHCTTYTIIHICHTH